MCQLECSHAPTSSLYLQNCTSTAAPSWLCKRLQWQFKARRLQSQSWRRCKSSRHRLTSDESRKRRATARDDKKGRGEIDWSLPLLARATGFQLKPTLLPFNRETWLAVFAAESFVMSQMTYLSNFEKKKQEKEKENNSFFQFHVLREHHIGEELGFFVCLFVFFICFSAQRGHNAHFKCHSEDFFLSKIKVISIHFSFDSLLLLGEQDELSLERKIFSCLLVLNKVRVKLKWINKSIQHETDS